MASDLENSGYTVKQILELAEKFPQSEISLKAFDGKGFFSIGPKGEYITTSSYKKMIDMLLKCKDTEATVYWSKDGKIFWKSKPSEERVEQITVVEPLRPESSTARHLAAMERALTYEKREMSSEEILELFNASCISVSKASVQAVVNSCLSELPANFSVYSPKEVIIHVFPTIPTTLKNLVAAGTKVIDAILFKAIHQENPYPFSIHPKTLTSGQKYTVSEFEMARNISMSHKALAAAYVFVWNQGYLPILGEEKPLPKFIRSLIFNDKLKTHNDFAEILSSASLRNFPGSCFLDPDLSGKIPSECIARCKMNIAGNKVIRYSVMANCFESRDFVSPDSNPNNFHSVNDSISLAIDIRRFLASLETDFSAQLKNHPMSDTRVPSTGLTKKLTHAILWSLSPRELERMCARIVAENRFSWMKDADFWGVADDETATERRYPIFDDSTADFTGTTLENVKAVWGKN